MLNLSFYIAPHVISKYYILKAVQQITQRFAFRGSILDVGCGEKPYADLFRKATEYVGIDFTSYSTNPTYTTRKPDVFFTKEYLKTFRLPFNDSSFDTVVSFQTLEHHKRPLTMIAEMRRVVRNGGYVVMSFPFIWGLHEEPHDYFRYTEYAIKELCAAEGLKIVYLAKQGSIYSTMLSLAMDALIEFSQKNTFTRIMALLLYPFFLIAAYLCLPLDKIFTSQRIFLNYLIVARKTPLKLNGKDR